MPAAAADDTTAAEDDGWVVGWLFHAGKAGQTAEAGEAGEAAGGRSQWVVLDARTMAEVARLSLRHHLPYALHGQWVPQYLGPPLPH